MFRFLLIFILLVSNSAMAQRFYGLSQPTDYQGFQKDTLTLLSWNVEHFIDQFDNPYINNRGEDKPDTSKVNQKIEKLVAVIRQSGADVVVLQEFESRNLAMQIAKEKLDSLGFRFFAGNESPDWYMNVVIMSKVPIGMVYGYGAMYSPLEGIKDSLGRAETQNQINTRICAAEIRVNEHFSFILTGVHLKAGIKERDSAMRLGQIELIKGQNRRFLKESSKTRLVLVGDLNATPESQEMIRLKSGNKKEKMIDLLQNTQIYSHPADNPTRRIDHILWNINMQKSVVANSVQPFVPFSNTAMRVVSDHLPMIAKFIVKK
jgi:endonuclease/exonuclease/phosphatase family metal-dependent hydrolase